MRIRSKIALVAAMTLLGGIIATVPAQADTGYHDPLTATSLFTYNHEAYSISIKALPSEPVTRFRNMVASQYSTRLILSTSHGSKVITTVKAGYWRTAYLRLKLVGQDVVRGYSLSTFAKKISAKSSKYAEAQVNSFVNAYRHSTLRGDVEATVRNVKAYVAKNGSISGIISQDVIVKSDGYFGYEAAMVVLVPPSVAASTDWAIHAYDPTDHYTVDYDYKSGKTTTGFIA